MIVAMCSASLIVSFSSEICKHDNSMLVIECFQLRESTFGDFATSVCLCQCFLMNYKSQEVLFW